MRPVFVPNYLLKAFKVRSLVLNYRAYKIGYGTAIDSPTPCNTAIPIQSSDRPKPSQSIFSSKWRDPPQNSVRNFFSNLSHNWNKKTLASC